MNAFGDKWVFTSFGESHGCAIGGVLDGVPAGTVINMDAIRQALDCRAGRTSSLPGVSPRASRESDEVEWLSGVRHETPASGTDHTERLIALGSPIAFIIRNRDAHPEDYEWLKQNYRSGHADFTYAHKYGQPLQTGGGRASARETASRVVAGEIARQSLAAQGITIAAHVSQVVTETDPAHFAAIIEQVQGEKDSIGGIVQCEVKGLPIGLGEPIFDKLQSHLAYAMLSINGCKGFDYGSGFAQISSRGSELYGEVPCPASGGIEGGLSNGLPLSFRCVFKPTSSIAIKGRHDACIALRAVAVVEAMTALVLRNFIE